MWHRKEAARGHVGPHGRDSSPPHETHSRTRNTIVVGADVAGPWVGVDTVTVATQTLVPGGWRGHGEVGGEAHVRVCIIR